MSHINLPALPEFHGRVFGDDVFTQRRQCNGHFNGRTGLGALRERQLLVHHRQDAAAFRIDGDHRAVHVPEGIDCGGTYNWIFSAGHVAQPLVCGERTCVEALCVALLRSTRHGVARCRRALRRRGPRHAAAAAHTADALLRAGVFGDLLLLRARIFAGRNGRGK